MQMGNRPEHLAIDVLVQTFITMSESLGLLRRASDLDDDRPTMVTHDILLTDALVYLSKP